MVRYLMVGVGLLFFMGVIGEIIDAIVHLSIPVIGQHQEAMAPLVTRKFSMPVNLLFDLFHLLIIGRIFLLLYPSLWGDTGLKKGVCFGVIVWFFTAAIDIMDPDFLQYDISIGGVLLVLVLSLIKLGVLGLYLGIMLNPNRPRGHQAGDSNDNPPSHQGYGYGRDIPPPGGTSPV